jgi:hypothetical protein
MHGEMRFLHFYFSFFDRYMTHDPILTLFGSSGIYFLKMIFSTKFAKILKLSGDGVLFENCL